MKWKQYRKRTLTEMALVRSDDELEKAGMPKGMYISRDPHPPSSAQPNPLDAYKASFKGRLATWNGHLALIRTKEGVVEAQYPFYLAIDAGGDPYPIALDIHAMTYDLVE